MYRHSIQDSSSSIQDMTVSQHSMNHPSSAAGVTHQLSAAAVVEHQEHQLIQHHNSWRQQASAARSHHGYSMDLMVPDQMIANNSFTLPHSMSHHSSKIIVLTLALAFKHIIPGFRVKDDVPAKHVVDNRKYGTVGRKPRDLSGSGSTYHALPRSSYLVLPPDPGHSDTVSDNTPDLLQDHDLKKPDDVGDAAGAGDEEDIYISTKF